MRSRWLLPPVLAALWLTLRSALAPVEAGVGLAVAAALTAVLFPVYDDEVSPRRLLRFLAWAPVYLVVFLFEIFVANFQLAILVLHPSLPIEPKVIEVPLEVETELGATIIANSITMTPGTLTLSHEEGEDGDYLRVHAVSGEREEVMEPIERMQRYASRMGV